MPDLKQLSVWAVRVGLAVSFGAYINGNHGAGEDKAAAVLVTVVLFASTFIPERYYNGSKDYLELAARIAALVLLLSLIAYSSATAAVLVTAKALPSLADIAGVSQRTVATVFFSVVMMVAWPALPEAFEAIRSTRLPQPGVAADANMSPAPEADDPPVIIRGR